MPYCIVHCILLYWPLLLRNCDCAVIDWPPLYQKQNIETVLLVVNPVCGLNVVLKNTAILLPSNIILTSYCICLPCSGKKEFQWK